MSRRRRVDQAGDDDQAFGWAVWRGARPFLIAIATDMVTFLGWALGLTVVFLVLRFLTVLGYSQEHLQTFDRLHFWASTAVLATFLLDLIFKVILFSFRRK
jgi:uncharacterized membrane protein YhdT